MPNPNTSAHLPQRTLAYVAFEALFKAMDVAADSPLLNEIGQLCGFEPRRRRQTYSLKTFYCVVAFFRQRYYTDMSDEDAFFEIGRRHAESYTTDTILGRVGYAASKHQSGQQLLETFLRNHNPLFNRGQRHIEHIAPGHSCITFADDTSNPHYIKGTLYAILQLGAFSDISVGIEKVGHNHHVYSLRWHEDAATPGST